MPDDLDEPGRTKKRLQFDFTSDLVQVLKDLQRATGAASIADVVRKSLALYEVLGPALIRGDQVLIRDADGKETRVLLAR